MKPIVCEGVLLRTVQDGADGSFSYYIVNAKGDEYKVSQELFQAFDDSEDDGFLSLPKHLATLEPQLEECGLISTSRFLGESERVLLQLGKAWERHMPLWKALRIILPIISVLLFSVGLYMTLQEPLPNGSFNVALCLYLVIISAFVHKFCHLVAGLSCGMRFQGLNLYLVAGIFPARLILTPLDNPDASPMERSIFSISGIEGNLLVAGITMIIALYFPSVSVTMFVTAIINTAWAIMNLLPWYGFDGERALSALVGVESITWIAIKCLLNKKCRQQYTKDGLRGYICLLLCSYTLLVDVFSIVAFIGCFIKSIIQKL